MRKTLKKLNLNRETVRGLEGGLDHAAGMTGPIGCYTGGCGTALTCRSAVLCATVAFPCETATGCIG